MSQAVMLTELGDALVRGLRVDVAAGEGVLAFERHQLLAIRFTRVARLNAPSKIKNFEGQVWSLYFEEHFPRGSGQADLLWHEWRTPLLKDETPGQGVAISHGQAKAHWQTTNPGGALFLNLESLWDEYEASIHHFIDACAKEETRAKRALDRWGRRQWEQRLLTFVSPGEFALLPVTASASSGGYPADFPTGIANQRRVEIGEQRDDDS